MKGNVVSISLIALLLFSNLSLGAHPVFHRVDSLEMNVVAICPGKGDVIYAATARSIFVMEESSLKVLRKVEVQGSSYPPIYHISGMGFNEKKGVLYISA